VLALAVPGKGLGQDGITPMFFWGSLQEFAFRIESKNRSDSATWIFQYFQE
jgi:hypothetical protein